MRAASRFAFIGVIGGLTAACSTDRFASSTPFNNPFSSGGSEPTRTGSVGTEPSTPAMPRSSIQSQSLPPVSSAPIAAPSSPSYGAPSRPRTAAGTAGWSTAGGTTVIVGPGETLSTLTSRYGVPGEAILSANSLKPQDVSAGRRVVIPVYSATGEGGVAPARRAEAPQTPVRYNAPSAPVAAAPRVVASQKIEVKKAPPRTLVEAAPPKSQLRPGQVVAKAPEPARPAVRVIEMKQPVQQAAKIEPKPAKVEAKATKVAKVEPKAAEKEILLPAKKLAKVEPAKPAKPEAPQKVAAAQKPAEPAKATVREPETTASIAPAAPVAASGSSSADFRWPARGRVISGFGSGGNNEGINIAVPEGTPVKAAGDGVVAYAGSEVKGYGNLVLIRHDNGYVSAYANNGQIDVKRGQRVGRGQAIAKSGQTGNVTSPQLHFEIRKGSTPVDPMKYLASAE